jgi:hypothetical protein
VARWNREHALWLAAYAVAMAALAGGLVHLRGQVLNTLDTPKARREWQAWREEMAREAEQGGPVQRRVPKSDVPPAVILFRDYFAACLATTLLIGTVVFAMIALGVRALFPRPPVERTG